MTLAEYIAACVKDSKAKTPKKITIDKALLTPLRNLRGQSESKVLEHGYNLFWKADQLELSKMTVGTYNKPNLNSTEAHKDDAYIGDIHSHPYKIKMGKDARIGPSTGDIDDYYKYKPRKFPLGVNMVMSSASVFLIVLRADSKLVDDEKLTKATQIDTQVLYEHVYGNPKLTKVLDSVANSKGGIQHWKAQKEVWEEVAPEAAAQFAKANLDMNLAFANLSKHELYYVEDIEKSQDLGLISKAVY